MSYIVKYIIYDVPKEMRFENEKAAEKWINGALNFVYIKDVRLYSREDNLITSYGDGVRKQDW